MAYDKYVSVEAPWIPNIPASWRMIPNKVLFTKRQIKVGDAFNDYQLLSLTTTGVKSKDISDSRGKVPASYSSYQVVHSQDMIFCLFDLDVSAVFSGLSAYEGMITSAYDVVECNTDLVDEEFVNYWFQFVFSNRYYKMYSKSVRYTLKFNAFGALKTPVPPLNEQKQIVRYLDWQISKINKLIATKRKEIDLLKERQSLYISHVITHGINDAVAMKDSGIEWIGEMPTHWKTLRCKYLFSERDERSLEGKEEHLSMSQKYGLVSDSQLDEHRMLSESYQGGKLCYENDLVLNRLKAHLGVFALAPQHGVISPDYTVLIPNIDYIVPAYGEMVLKSEKCRRELRIRVRGIIEGFWRLYTGDFNTIVLPVPSIDEQKVIMQNINEYATKSKEYENNLLKEIGVLHELRTKLIFDVVTGQIDVRDIEIPDYEFVEEDTHEESEENIESAEGEMDEE